MRTPALEPDLGTLLQNFFCDRLIQQRGASPHTVASYRDTFQLLLNFIHQRSGRSPAQLTLAEVDAPVVLAFLEHLERKRANSVRTRNARLAAVRSFLQYAALRAPTALPGIQRVLAIPQKRFDRKAVRALTRAEVQAVLGAPDPGTWSGRRDRTLIQTLYNTGARVSELVGVTQGDLDLARGGSVRLRGKGRKERSIPLWRTTRRMLLDWLRGQPSSPSAPVFQNRRGGRLTRSGVQARLRVAVTRGATDCHTLKRLRISPHTIRHTTAMHLLEAGVDISVIALWLGHESPATTHCYLEADLAMKQRALAKLNPPRKPAQPRFRPGDRLLAFLEGL